MVVHNLFDEIVKIDNLITSWKEFRIGKKDRLDTIEFERNLEDNLWELHQELADKTYKHSGYTSFFVQDPKLRHIHKALVRDRVLHHAIVKHVNPIFDKTFIHDSYSCRKDKGTHRGVEQLIRYARIVSKNNTQPCWILKCDIRKFFASVDQKILIDIIFGRIRSIHTRRLLEEVISSFSSDRTVDPSEPKGLPIGNLTSQLFANIYLNELDQFIKHKPKVKLYVRYCDDFVILSQSLTELKNLLPKIENFLESKLKLRLHENKMTIRKPKQGIDFLGYVLLRNCTVMRTKTKKRMVEKVNSENLASYTGLLKHCNGYELSKKVLMMVNLSD